MAGRTTAATTAPTTAATHAAAAAATTAARGSGRAGPPTADAAGRSYLRSGDRRAQILEAAALIAGRDGLAALTMAGVAGEAGVSRQWVHGHFTDLAGLYRALLFDRFAALDARLDAEAGEAGGAERARFVARQVMAASPADRRILRAAIDGGLHRELEPVEDEVRARILDRWVPVMAGRGRSGGRAGRRPGSAAPGDAEARAAVLGAVGAVFGIADQAARDGLDRDRAAELAAGIISALAERG